MLASSLPFTFRSAALTMPKQVKEERNDIDSHKVKSRNLKKR